jgi:hypothetical protein
MVVTLFLDVYGASGADASVYRIRHGMDGAADSATWTRSTILLFVALAVAAAASTAWLVHPWHDTGLGANDSSVYVLCGQALLRGEGYSYLGHPFLLRPPGFSALLVPVLAVFGLDFHAFNLFVALWGVACVVLLAAFQRARIGTALALVVALVAWTNPLFQTFCNRAMSDVPATAALMLGLLLDRRAGRRESWKRDVVLGVVIGLSGYLRSVNALLLIAVAGARVAGRWTSGERRGWPVFAVRRLGPVTVATLLVLSPWWVRDALCDAEASRDQVFSFSYSTALFHEARNDPDSAMISAGDAGRRAGANLGYIASALGARLRCAERGPASPSHVVLGAALLALALIALARRRGAADFMLAGLLLLYVIWPSLWLRHLLPVFLLAVPAALDTLAWLASRFVPRAIATAVLAALVCVVAAHDFEPRRGWAEVEESHARYVAGCAAIEAALPSDAVLAAPVGWHLSVHLRRPVFNLAPATVREKGLDALERVVDRYRVNTVIAADFAGDVRRFEQYLVRRHGPGLDVGGARLFRVRS